MPQVRHNYRIHGSPDAFFVVQESEGHNKAWGPFRRSDKAPAVMAAVKPPSTDRSRALSCLRRTQAKWRDVERFDKGHY